MDAGAAALPVDASARQIILIGMMASGKTTVARLLSEQLARQWVDLDDCISQQCGMSVAEIFARHGEVYFRQQESDQLDEQLSYRYTYPTPATPAIVLSTGGGVVVTAANRKLMHQRGVVFYLHAPVGVLAERLQAEPPHTRPLLADADSAEEALTKLARQREAWYRQTAHCVVDASAPAAAVARCIIQQIKG